MSGLHGCLFTGAVRPRARRPSSEHARSPLGGARPHYATQELARCCCGGGSDGDCELTADGCTAVRLAAGGWRLRLLPNPHTSNPHTNTHTLDNAVSDNAVSV